MNAVVPAIPIAARRKTIPKSSSSDLLDKALPLTQPPELNRELSIAHYSIAIDELSVLLSNELRMEVVEASTLYYLPHAPQWCSGLINLRGQPIPVLRLQQLFYPERHMQSKTQAYKWLLVVRSQHYAPIAFMLDALPRIVHDDEYQQGGFDVLEHGINVAPQLAMYISDIYRYKEKEVLMLLNHERLLSVLKTSA